MKSPNIFFCVMIFVTCCVFTWTAEKPLNQLLGYICIISSMAVFGKIIINKLVDKLP
ncbi:MAG: hypothetical protein ABIN67_13900 [Ferruginibacter sp.]